MDEMGHTGPCCLFFLMEICAEKLERNPNKTLESSDCLFEFHERIVRQKLKISLAKLEHFLGICQGFGLLSYEFHGKFLKISMPMLLDLLEYDQKKSRTRTAPVPPSSRLEKNRIEKNRIEKNIVSTAVENSTSMPPQLVPVVVEKVSKKTGAIFELEHDQTAFTLLQDVTKDLQTKWLAAYPSPDWIVHEIKKADVWMTANPSKRPKNFGRFMSGWLAKGFESYRKGLPTNQKTYSQKNADALSEMLQMVDEGTL